MKSFKVKKNKNNKKGLHKNTEITVIDQCGKVEYVMIVE